MTQAIQPANQPVRLEHIPSIHATHASGNVSERYGFIPTSTIVSALEREGFVPVKASAARSRPDRAAFAKHMIRFRHREHQVKQVGDWLPEVVLVNSHDGSSSYQIMAGVFRLVCLNGLVVGNSIAEARVRHTKNAAEEIVDASYRVIESLPELSDGVREMQSIRLEPEERQAFATAALTLRYPEDAPIRPEQLLSPRRHADQGNDLWTQFNVVQEHLLKGGQRRADSRRSTRKISSVGEDVRLNRALWTLAEELKRLKS
jgi:Domain of unknown function (DUF932)